VNLSIWRGSAKARRVAPERTKKTEDGVGETEAIGSNGEAPLLLSVIQVSLSCVVILNGAERVLDGALAAGSRLRRAFPVMMGASARPRAGSKGGLGERERERSSVLAVTAGASAQPRAGSRSAGGSGERESERNLEGPACGGDGGGSESSSCERRNARLRLLASCARRAASSCRSRCVNSSSMVISGERGALCC
jgi:hypothetical protein